MVSPRLGKLLLWWVDVDVDKVEAKIKACFGAIPQPKNAEKRVYYPVSDNKEMIVFCAKDAEQPVPSFSLYMKRDVTPWAERQTVEAYKDNYLTNLVISMLNNRFDVLQKKHSKRNPCSFGSRWKFLHFKHQRTPLC